MARAAHKAARGLVRDFGEVEQLQASMKGPAGFVDHADRRAGEIVRSELQRARPDYSFLVEDGEGGGGFLEHRFIVDALDGAVNFLHGLPHFAISIALEQHGELTAAVIHDPLRGETFVADRGGGAFVNERRLRVSSRSDLRLALVGTAAGEGAGAALHARIARIEPEVAAIRRQGCPALDLAWLAAGRLDGFVGERLEPWHLAAGILLLREAGGMAARLEGDPVLEPGTLVAGTPSVALKLQRLLTAR
jgi:myo-inositol-1(or 4)-monophosphatase